MLGRNHVFIDGPAERCKRIKGFDMNDYARQTVELSCSTTGTQPEKLRKVTTPFCPDGSLPPEDDQSAGESPKRVQTPHEGFLAGMTSAS